MEKSAKGRRFNLRNPFCTPRTGKNNRVSPISLLDRFREAVFRLIMLSALSKATNHERKPENVTRSTSYQYSSSYESHHTEAVADCIEFIKKSAVHQDHHRESTESNSIDAATEVVLPVPVM